MPQRPHERLKRLYADFKTFILPHSEKKLLVPTPPRKMATKYIPPYQISADINPEDNFNDFRAQLEEMAKHPNSTPPTRKFAASAGDKIRKYEAMPARSKTDIAIKKKLAEEIFDSAKFIQSRWQETHGEGGAMQTLLDVKSYYEEQDLLLKFGDIFAANLNRIKNWPRDHEPWLKKATWVTNDWQNISAMIQEEDDQLKKHRQIRKPQGENTNGVKWEIAQAAKRLGISDLELEWEVHTYAQRNHMAHLGIAKDAELGDFDEVACILASLREKLGCADIPAKTKSQYDSALQLFEKEYFKVISYKKFFTQGMTPLFVLHDKYEERRQRRIHEEFESEKKEQEEEEARLGRIRQWEADVESGRVNLMGGGGRRTANMTV